MLIFNPKLFLVLALALSGGYLYFSQKAKPRAVDPKAVQWVMGRMDKSTSTLASPLVDGSLERLAAQEGARMDAIVDNGSTAAKPPHPPENLQELTVEALIKAMEAALFSVPDAVPHLPLMPSLVHDLMRNDPQGIGFGPTPGAWGLFSTADPKHPRITLSPDLQELHRKGVPTPLIAAVLVHELDHLLMYMGGRGKGKGRNDKEYTAFRSQGLYLSSMWHHDGDAVEADDSDPVKKAYLADLKKIREKMFSGQLPQLIQENYGKDPDSAQPSQQKR